MKSQIDRESADRLGLSLDQYYSYAADVHNGMREQSAYQKQLLSQAREAGHMSISDCLLAQRSEKDAAQVKEDERVFVQCFLDMQKEAKEAGYYTVDEFAYQGRMTEWTPKSSQIMNEMVSHSCLTSVNVFRTLTRATWHSLSRCTGWADR